MVKLQCINRNRGGRESKVYLVYIPKLVFEDAGFSEGDEVDLSVDRVGVVSMIKRT